MLESYFIWESGMCVHALKLVSSTCLNCAVWRDEKCMKSQIARKERSRDINKPTTNMASYFFHHPFPPAFALQLSFYVSLSLSHSPPSAHLTTTVIAAHKINTTCCMEELLNYMQCFPVQFSYLLCFKRKNNRRFTTLASSMCYTTHSEHSHVHKIWSTLSEHLTGKLVTGFCTVCC